MKQITVLNKGNFISSEKRKESSNGSFRLILIDEWDCLFHEYKQNKDAQKRYLDFLRMWLKDQDYVALAYMTGILPIIAKL